MIVPGRCRLRQLPDAAMGLKIPTSLQLTADEMIE